MKTAAGETVSLVVSLLDNVMNTPPDGAGALKVTGNAVCSPGATMTPDGSTMSGEAQIDGVKLNAIKAVAQKYFMKLVR
jgi:hypothetical protein